MATFTPASPMMVSTGDILGLAGGSGTTCAWSGGGTPLDDMTDFFGALAENPGDAYSVLGSGPFAVDVGATLVATEDSAVTTTVQPGTVAAGGSACWPRR